MATGNCALRQSHVKCLSSNSPFSGSAPASLPEFLFPRFYSRPANLPLRLASQTSVSLRLLFLTLLGLWLICLWKGLEQMILCKILCTSLQQNYFLHEYDVTCVFIASNPHFVTGYLRNVDNYSGTHFFSHLLKAMLCLFLVCVCATQIANGCSPDCVLWELDT